MVNDGGPSKPPASSTHPGSGAAAGGAPAHAAFPTATDLMRGAASSSSTAPSSTSRSQSSSFPPAGAVGNDGKVYIPNSAEQLYGMITSTPPQDAFTLRQMLDTLAGGPLIGDQRRPAPLLLLPGLAISGVSDRELTNGTYGFIYVFSARLNNGERSAELLDSAIRFSHLLDPNQLHQMPDRVAEFAWSLLRLAQSTKRVDAVLPSLVRIMRAMNEGPYFNPVHAVFLEACLYVRDYESAYQSVVKGPRYINARGGTYYGDVLTFHHHAGTIAAILGDYERATELFTFAAAMPAYSLSAVQIACAKRAILCELLSTGKQLQFPKDSSSIVTRYLEKNISEYTTLAKAFSAKDWKVARDSAQSAAFEQDCNQGLVNRLMASVTKRRILNLRRTYSRMAVADLAAKLKLSSAAGEAEVLAAIQGMVDAGEIRATVSSTPAVVTFLDDDDYASPENMAKLKEEQLRAAWLLRDVEYGNKEIGLKQKWLEKQIRNMDSKEKASTQTRAGFDVDDIGPAPVRGVGSNLADIGF